jgi:hypothetical protein
MLRVVIFVAFALLNTVGAAVAPKLDKNERLPLSLVEYDVHTSNASLVEKFLVPPNFADPVKDLSPFKGSSPDQWLLPRVFKRQSVCTNYCSASTPKGNYCTCGQQCCGGTLCCATASGYACCGGQGCCNTAANSFCCGASCCINGATCNGNSACVFKT